MEETRENKRARTLVFIETAYEILKSVKKEVNEETSIDINSILKDLITAQDDLKSQD